MKIWFPTIRANTGADIFIINLAKGLEKKGIETKITWLPHIAEILPYPFQYIKAPNDIDIIHSNSWYGFSFKKNHIPTVISVFHWVHDEAMSPYKSKAQKIYHNNFIKRYEYSSIESATAVVAISKYTGEQLFKNFPDKEGITVINNGIDADLFIPNRKKVTQEKVFNLLFVGTPNKRKGFDLLGEIMGKLPTNIVLRYIDGDIKSESNNIIKTGKLNLSQLISLYQFSDALLFPTRYEGFGYVAAEAMACEKPVITSDNSAMPELVKDKETGFLCKTDDIDAFCNAITILSENSLMKKKLGEAAREHIINNFTLENMIDKYINLYKSILSS